MERDEKPRLRLVRDAEHNAELARRNAQTARENFVLLVLLCVTFLTMAGLMHPDWAIALWRWFYALAGAIIGEA